MAYVESYDDIAFWRTLLAEFENEERYFNGDWQQVSINRTSLNIHY